MSTSSITDEVVNEGHLPGLWEGMRMVSGLIAVIALVALALFTTLHAGDASQSRASSAALPSAAAPMEPAPRAGFFPSAPYESVVAFYLVSTPEEAEIAAWGEQQAAMESFAGGLGLPYRTYHILEGASSADLLHAGQTIIDYLIRDDAAIVEVIDLRGAGPQAD